jgi:hypothetical protein
MTHMSRTCIFFGTKINPYIHVNSQNAIIFFFKKKKKGSQAIWGWLCHPLSQMGVVEPTPKDLGVISAKLKPPPFGRLGWPNYSHSVQIGVATATFSFLSFLKKINKIHLSLFNNLS